MKMLEVKIGKRKKLHICEVLRPEINDLCQEPVTESDTRIDGIVYLYHPETKNDWEYFESQIDYSRINKTLKCG
jgi:hypothetical protein